MLLTLSAANAYEGDGYRDFLVDHGYLQDHQVVRQDDRVHVCYRVASNELKPEDVQAWRDIAGQSVSAVVSGGEGLTYIATSEGGDTRSRVYLTALDAAGRTLWGPVAADTSIAPQDYLQLISRGEDGVILSWIESPYDCADQKGREIRFKAQKFDRHGNRLWGQRGLTIHESPWRYRYELLPNGADGATGVWFGWDEGPYMYVQQISGDGTKRWPEQGKKVLILGFDDFNQIKVVATTDGGLMLSIGAYIWTSEAGHPLAMPVSSDAELAWKYKGNYGTAFDPYLLKSESAGITLFGRKNAKYPNHRHLTLLRLDDHGMVEWETILDDSVGQPDYDYSKGRIREFVPDGAGGVIAIWIKDGTEDSLILAQHVDKEGKVLWEKPALLGSGRIGVEVDAAPDGAGGAFVTWITNDMSRGRQWPAKAAIIFQDIRIQQVAADGELTWKKPAFVASNIGKALTLSTIAPDGAHGAIVAWSDGRAGFDIAPMREEDKFEESEIPDPQITSHIYAQRVAASGEMVWQDDGINISGSKHAPKNCYERTSSEPIVGALAVNLRTTPSLASDILKPLYRGTELSVLERSDRCETINGRLGRWVRVREQASADTEGWVFDAFLVYPQHADLYPIWPMVP